MGIRQCNLRDRGTELAVLFQRRLNNCRNTRIQPLTKILLWQTYFQALQGCVQIAQVIIDRAIHAG